jgi:hypothetical protein
VAYQASIFWCLYDEVQTTVCHEGQELVFVKRSEAAFDDDHLTRVHTNRGLNEDAWNAVVTVLSKTLHDFNIESDDIQAILSAVGSKKDFIVQAN